ncbi:Fat3p KNAG_0D04540 [Huiozyma naganishii CBS 8797]|uniref:Uncharacterized protein n=1 Tax=Huiozyma naganishii (strain ATCC MYA-139 / BCRC 22969 / CBS 8797 / KCTC 17520 / NBRC 10181 / NCYC 3082 / Yp74L-3) TaxID=1071383 RepID=J7S646_HUIN7|nr:hypothetical protein KNAG_0D04540 [Kazachstania naganishii CBS 8797]CCK70199.1 hypothetical protein KNAG_0D04540 [Kazachstania naganishii CBS 8797]
MRLLPKEPHSPRRNILWLCLSLLFVFTAFILTIVATAGSTANYSPINNVYLGKADISHINVSKVIPQMSPILTILGTALTAPNSSLDQIFGALRNVADTPALTPLMVLLSNANNTNDTIIALTDLAPLALEGNPEDATKEAGLHLQDVMRQSNNGNDTLIGLDGLVMANLNHLNDSQVANSSETTLSLLMDSSDPLETTRALRVLNNMTLSQKTSMLPVFNLFQYSDNTTALTESLHTIMNSSADIPPSMATTLLTTLQSSLSSGSSNIDSVFNSLSNVVTSQQRPALQAIESMLKTSNNVNGTLTTLGNMIRANITQNPAAKIALPALITVVDNAGNTTQALAAVQSLALVRDTALADEQLASLGTMLNVSTNQKQTVQSLVSLEEGLTPNSTTIQYIPSLFKLIEASGNPAKTFPALVTLTSWAQQNPDTFKPIVSILQSANSVTPVTPEQMRTMTPQLLQYLEIPIYYRLSIFTLCKANINDDIIECSESHAVQNMDFRQIVYDSLVASQFYPYMRALDIGPQDLYLEGKLLSREHEYVPSIKAVLAMNILSIVTNFAVCCFIVYILISGWKHMWAWYTVIILNMWGSLFGGLSGTIISVVLEVIKSGTHDDNYGVVFTSGDAYLGLIWTAFALSFITGGMLILSWWCARKWVRSTTRGVQDSDYEKASREHCYNQYGPGQVEVVPAHTNSTRDGEDSGSAFGNEKLVVESDEVTGQPDSSFSSTEVAAQPTNTNSK